MKVFREKYRSCEASNVCRKLSNLDLKTAVRVLHLLPELTPSLFWNERYEVQTQNPTPKFQPDSIEKVSDTKTKVVRSNRLLDVLDNFHAHYHLLGSHLPNYRGSDEREKETGINVPRREVDTVLIACAYLVLAYHTLTTKNYDAQ